MGSPKECSRCGQKKPLTDFCKKQRSKDGFHQQCKSCVAVYQKSYRRDHGATMRTQSEAWNKENREYYLFHRRVTVQALKQKCLSHYSDELPARCACCGEKNFGFLTLDHSNNDGGLHREETGSGSRFYRWLVKNGMPDLGLRVMCFNCNSARAAYGMCPHEPEFNVLLEKMKMHRPKRSKWRVV